MTDRNREFAELCASTKDRRVPSVDVTCLRCGETYTVEPCKGDGKRDYVCICGNHGKI